MAVTLKTIFSDVKRLSAPKGAGQLLTGRWATLNASGEAILPGAGLKAALYLVLEGNVVHIGTNLEFAVGAPFDSTKYEALPAVESTGAVCLAYGDFVVTVGPEGVNPLAAYVIGNGVEVDASGRLIPLAAGVMVGRVEGLTSDANGVTTLTIKATGN